MLFPQNLKAKINTNNEKTHKTQTIPFLSVFANNPGIIYGPHAYLLQEYSRTAYLPFLSCFLNINVCKLFTVISFRNFFFFFFFKVVRSSTQELMNCKTMKC